MYISSFEKKGHKRIPNAPLVPENDPTTLFTSSGMQPLVPYLLGEQHPQGKRLVNVQNCFRAQDIDEVGDNRHTTFFRMLGNWSLGDYFKKEQLTWFFEFLTKGLGLNPRKLYVSVFQGFNDIQKDTESEVIWKQLFSSAGIDPKDRIYFYGVEKNWWSRSGLPQDMPTGEPGGPDSEVFYDFGPELHIHEQSQWKDKPCHPNCDCGRFLEIGNSVFMQYKKQEGGRFIELPHRNVDFGGGLERLLAAVENKQDIFQTSLFQPIITSVENATGYTYSTHARQMRIIADHFIAATFIAAGSIKPSNKEQGYIVRRLIRRGLDNFYEIAGKDIAGIIEQIVEQYKDTDPELANAFPNVKSILLAEEQTYKQTLHAAKKFIAKRYKIGDELKGLTEIAADDAFALVTTHGLSPSQIKSLGFIFNEQKFAEKMKKHQTLSKRSATKKFAGGLADDSEKTVMGHTATHLLHQALRDVLGNHVHQTGSNITSERIRFDYNYDQNLTDEQLKSVEHIVNDKIRENLPVHFEMMPLSRAKETGAIGLFDNKYSDKVKVYFVGNYSKEFCGGPHVDFTGRLKRVKILKQENIGHGQRRIYAVVNPKS